MRNDDILLTEAYSKIYNEGIWDRLKGQASGVGSGLKQGFQNVAAKTANALGANVQSSGETMGASYANAQQTSLLNSFIKKAQKEIADFNNDISKMGVNPNDQQFPEIKAQLDSVNNLIKFLQNPQAEPPPEASQPTPAPEASQQTPAPSQINGANFNANVAGKSPAVVHGRQLSPVTSQSYTSSPVTSQSYTSSPARPMKNVTPYREPQPPVQKALTPPPELEAEVIDEPVQSKKGNIKTSTVPVGKIVTASETDLTGSGGMVPRKYIKKADGWYSQGNMKVGPNKSAALDKVYQKQSKKQSNMPQQQSAKSKTKPQPKSFPKIKAKPQKNKPKSK